MAHRIPRPCRVSRCRHRTTQTNGYCDRHQPVHRQQGWASWQKDKGTVTERGYGSPWQRLRLEILKRDDDLCQQCLKTGRLTRASHVDHIVPKARGGDDTFDNLQSLCPSCHQRKTGADQRLPQPLGGGG